MKRDLFFPFKQCVVIRYIRVHAVSGMVSAVGLLLLESLRWISTDCAGKESGWGEFSRASGGKDERMTGEKEEEHVRWEGV